MGSTGLARPMATGYDFSKTVGLRILGGSASATVTVTIIGSGSGNPTGASICRSSSAKEPVRITLGPLPVVAWPETGHSVVPTNCLLKNIAIKTCNNSS